MKKNIFSSLLDRLGERFSDEENIVDVSTASEEEASEPLRLPDREDSMDAEPYEDPAEADVSAPASTRATTSVAPTSTAAYQLAIEAQRNREFLDSLLDEYVSANPRARARTKLAYMLRSYPAFGRWLRKKAPVELLVKLPTELLQKLDQC